MKPVIEALDSLPALPAAWLSLVAFAAGYYQRGLGDGDSGGGRTGQRDQRHPRVLKHAFADCRSAADDQVEDPLGQIIVAQHIPDGLLHCDGGQGGLGGGLPDDDIAANRCDHGVPGPNRDRKVEGGDHTDHAEGMVLVVHAVAVALRMHGESIQQS